MNEAITFDDVLIRPKFTTVESRKDVDLSVKALGLDLKLGIISANMDTITGIDMARAMSQNGAVGCLHRFMSIEENLDMFRKVAFYYADQVMCSVGLGKKELERAVALVGEGGCTSIIVDVANGASMSVVNQVKELRELIGNDFYITVGNFATAESVETFLSYIKTDQIQGLKVGVGPGSRCRTRGVTGVGYPQLSAIMEISKILKRTEITVIADGGLNSSGDCCKALGAGAHLLMSGSFFAGTEESPGETVWKSSSGFVTKDIVFPSKLNDDGTYSLMEDCEINLPAYKKYRGSASKESYEDQGKTGTHRAPEGDCVYIPCKGPVKDILQQLEGGLRSAFTYTGSRNLEEFHKNCEFVRVSTNTVVENGTRNGVK